ncbi:MAG: hypothetical protein DWH88_04455 [Planctomycetota bacterium]|nr:MAG: hypothetical protein DWH88_04455 [Planctomycetota bacterium]
MVPKHVILASILFASWPSLCLSQVVIAPEDRQPVRIQGRQQAPEFEDIAEWINTKPLAMKELRGKVVVVHFMAFG